MVSFSAILEKFAQQAEKTGWTYIRIPSAVAAELKSGKQGFRVKGKIDRLAIRQVALLPSGDGDFIMPVNAAMRKGIGKSKGASVRVQLQLDAEPIRPPSDLLECLKDEPVALANYQMLKVSFRNYFTKWIDSAKTEPTRAKRIAHTINALCKGWDFGKMLRAAKEDRAKLQ